MIADRLRRGERFSPIVEVHSRKDECPKGNDHQGRAEVVDVYPRGISRSLLNLVFQQWIAVLDGQQSDGQRGEENQPPTDEL